MESILGRSHFLSETANLFSDEKTVNARSKVVDWFNEIAIADAQKKVELLIKVQEIILGSCIELLDEFLEFILPLAHDVNMEVRKQVSVFLEKICQAKVEFLPQIINIISMLLRDRSPQVIKRVIQACNSIYKNGLQWICGHSEVTDSVEQTWNVLSILKAQILDLIDNENEGIRTNAIKFLEGAVILQTYPDEDSQKKENDFSLADVPNTFKIFKRQKLEDEALNIFDILLQFHAATHISAVNLIACSGSLCTIAKLRPSLMGTVVEALKNLLSNLPPTLTDSQVSSVRKSLKFHFLSLIKNKGSYEFHATIKNVLLDMGVSLSEIQRALPKMDKQEQVRRQKRILENAASSISKRARLGEVRIDQLTEIETSNEVQEMEIDEDELEKQRLKSNRVNEKFIAENLRTASVAVDLAFEFAQKKLPDEIPSHYLTEYTPNLSLQQQIVKISKLLGEQMTEKKVGPGCAVFSKEPPMRPKRVRKTNTSDTGNNGSSVAEVNQIRKEEATKKLRENMERVKGEQELIERMKQRAKALKLQEVTKTLSRSSKEKFLLSAINRIVSSERQCFAGGVAAKRRKILTVAAATFPDNVRYFVFEYIMKDIKQRIDLAFSWLYEEYCLYQGFTRHSYVKSENSPDYAYNELLNQLITRIREKCEHKDKIILLRQIYLEVPLLTENAISQLMQMCFEKEISHCFLKLLKDLIVLRVPRRKRFLQILLTMCVHENDVIRDLALEHLITIYNDHKILPISIEQFALKWSSYLDNETPPTNIFSEEFGRPTVEITWKEHTTKICLNILLHLLPYNAEIFLEKLRTIYQNAIPDQKRTILRSIDVPIKKLGVENPHLLKLIENCTLNAETLIIRIIRILTEGEPTPNIGLVERIRKLYANKSHDVRILIPILNGLTRQEVLNVIPKLIKLSTPVLREGMNRLLGIGAEFANQTMPVTPTDVLVALHNTEPTGAHKDHLKFVVRATSMCFCEKEIFTQDVLIGVLQQLVETVPIPTLLMRTILQSLTLYPRLTNFVLTLLQRLILKQVWKDELLWEGFLKCCQKLKPHSMSVLLQLPLQQLIEALKQCPDMRAPLLEYAESIRDEPMNGITPQILDVITGKTVDVFITDETGGYISVDNIKKEKDDQQEISAILTVPALNASTSLKAINTQPADPGQPLPPGEE